MLLCYSDRIHRAFCALFGAVLQTKRFEGGLTLLWKKKKLFPKILSSLRLTKIWQRAFTIMSRRDFLRNRTDIFILDTLNRLFWTLDWQKNTTENSIHPFWWHQPDEGEDGVCWVDHRGCKMAGRWFWGPPVFCIQLFPADVWVCSSSY